jgi:hypothetical protein
VLSATAAINGQATTVATTVNQRINIVQGGFHCCSYEHGRIVHFFNAKRRYQNKAPRCLPGATDRDCTHVFDIYLSQTSPWALQDSFYSGFKDLNLNYNCLQDSSNGRIMENGGFDLVK